MSLFALVCSVLSIIISLSAILISVASERTARRSLSLSRATARAISFPHVQDQGSRRGLRYKVEPHNDAMQRRVYEDGTEILVPRRRRGV